MSRLVAVSNRVTDLHDPGQAGGLAVGLGDAFKARGGIWFGWDGKTVGQGTHVAPHVQKFDRATTITLPMTNKDYREFYAGFANSVLWPKANSRPSVTYWVATPVSSPAPSTSSPAARSRS